MDFDPGQMLRQLPVGVLVCDEHGAVLWLNAMLERLFSSSSGELRGASWSALPIAPAPSNGAVRRFRLLNPASRRPPLLECTTRTLLLDDRLVQVSCFSPLREVSREPGDRSRPVLRLVG